MAGKKLSKEEKDLCRVVTPPFRVSYPHLFKAQAPEGSKPKFSVTMLFPKDKDMIGTTLDGAPRSLKAAIKNCKLATFGPKESWPVGIESCIRDGDGGDFIDAATGKPPEGYAGHWVIKATSNEDSQPGLVDEEGVPIVKPADFYPGCFARAYIFAYHWTFGKKQGIGFILDHVQKTDEGKPFGGKTPIGQVFAPIGKAKAKPADDDDDEDEDQDF